MRCVVGPCRRQSGNNNSAAGSSGSAAAAGSCGTILQFIAQLYCPADDTTKNTAAFHRSIYVFACPTCCSTIARDEEMRKKYEEGEDETNQIDMSSVQQHRLSSCIRVLRCQLPLQNDFYPYQCSTPPTTTTTNTTLSYDNDNMEHPPWLLHTSEHWAHSTNNPSLHLCAVCGQRSQGKCPKQQLWFCGKEHQRECLQAWKEMMRKKNEQLKKKGSDGGDEDDMSNLNEHLPSVCHEYELVVEDEPSPPTTATADASSHHSNNGNGNINTLFSNMTNAGEGDDDKDDDADLEQSDLNALVAAAGATRGGGRGGGGASMVGVTDPITLAFYDRLAIGGTENDVKDQCLRYCRWPERERERANKKKKKSKMMIKEKTPGGDAETVDDDEVIVGPLWLSSRNRPPPSITTPAATVAATTANSQAETSSSSSKHIDVSTTTTIIVDNHNTNDTFPPPCQYCGAPRSFEFQIMPQMLYYLLQSSSDETKKNDDKFGTQKLLSDLDKAILFEGQSKIDNGIDLPSGFMEAHSDAMKSARESLLGVVEKEKQAEEDMDKNNAGGRGRSLDWGTIAVYTCTASCGSGGIVSKENGAYMEEVAWMQPPL